MMREEKEREEKGEARGRERRSYALTNFGSLCSNVGISSILSYVKSWKDGWRLSWGEVGGAQQSKTTKYLLYPKAINFCTRFIYANYANQLQVA